jgi:hypothetical protein
VFAEVSAKEACVREPDPRVEIIAKALHGASKDEPPEDDVEDAPVWLAAIDALNELNEELMGLRDQVADFSALIESMKRS